MGVGTNLDIDHVVILSSVWVRECLQATNRAWPVSTQIFSPLGFLPQVTTGHS